MTTHVFGPVPSRRLGRSLGVDLVPFKTCSFDCIYCQLGRTTSRTTARSRYVPLADVIADVAGALDGGVRPDYVTLSGSGEPTLHTGLGEVINRIKRLTDIPVALLTNGSLLWDAEVRAACRGADVVLPTLAAHDEETYRRVHRPADGLTLQRHLDGLFALRDEHHGAVWLELFLLQDINAGQEDLERFADLIGRLRPERIQINTAVRPTSEPNALAVPAGALQSWAERLGPTAEVVADVPISQRGRSEATEADVLALCRRRPCTLDQIATALCTHRNEIAKYVGALRRAGTLRSQWREEKEYYSAQ